MSVAHGATKGHIDAQGLSVVMLVSEGCLATRVMPIWVACIATWQLGVSWAQDAIAGHVWVCGPAVARVWINVCGYCCHQGLC